MDVENQAGLSDEELARFRELLREERARLLGAADYLERESSGSLLDETSELVSGSLDNHPADTASETYEREFDEGLEEGVRQTIREIDAALARIADGSYGLCAGRGEPIAKERLAAIPWTRYCREDAERLGPRP